MGRGARLRWRRGGAAAASSLRGSWGSAAWRGVLPVGRWRAWVEVARTRQVADLPHLPPHTGEGVESLSVGGC